MEEHESLSEQMEEKILQWILEYAATIDNHRLIQAIKDMNDDLFSNSNGDVKKRIALTTMLGMAQNIEDLPNAFTLFESIVPTECTNYRNIHQQFKVQAIISWIRRSKRDFQGFRQALDELLKPSDSQEIKQDLKRISIIFKMSLQEAQLRKNELDNLLKKYDHTKFLEQLNSFVSHVKKNYFSKPFLEQVYNDTISGLYKTRTQISSPLYETSVPESLSTVKEKNLRKELNTPQASAKTLHWEEEEEEEKEEEVEEKEPSQKKVLGKRKRRPWSTDEVDKLYRAIARFGVGKWAMMVNYYEFYDRTAVDLKDKWRTLNKQNQEECLKRVEEEFQFLKRHEELKSKKLEREEE